MSGVHHRLVDPVQDLRREQAQVFLQGLQLVVSRIVPVAMAQHLTDAPVLVGQVVDAVVIGIQAQPQHAQHQDVPLRHARPAGVRAGLARPVRLVGEDLFEDGEHALAQLWRGVEMLQTPQQLVDVVTGFRVKDEVGDVGQSKLGLWVVNDAHGWNSRDEDFAVCCPQPIFKAWTDRDYWRKWRGTAGAGLKTWKYSNSGRNYNMLFCIINPAKSVFSSKH